MSTEPTTIVRRVARWTTRIAIGACALVGVYQLVIPTLVTDRLRSTLTAAGYPDARFDLARVGFSHLELEDVWLRNGLSLGAVSVDAGPWRLWRGGSFGVALRGPQLDLASVAELQDRRAGSGAGAKTPLRRIDIADGSVRLADEQISVRGSIDLRRAAPAIDLVATSDRLQLGSVLAHDVAAQVRVRDGELRACVTGTVDGALGKACTQTRTLDPRKLDALDVTWEASDADASTWLARGTGRLVRTGRSVALRDGHAEVSLDRRLASGIDLDAATLRADLDGDLTDLSLSVRGTLHAGAITTGPVVLREVDLPFAMRATATRSGLLLTGETPLVAQLATAAIDVRGRRMRIDTPVVSARGQLALAAGRIRLRSSAEDGAAEGDDALQVAIRVRGLELAPMLDLASGGRVHGTGLLDGGVELELADDAWAITGGRLTARGRGVLQASDAAWRTQAAAAAQGVDVQQRLTAALADFRYTRLAFVFGRDPDLQLAMHGRGARVPQEIDFIMNVRGLGRVADRIGIAQLGRRP